jgi:hypothetical protein
VAKKRVAKEFVLKPMLPRRGRVKPRLWASMVFADMEGAKGLGQYTYVKSDEKPKIKIIVFTDFKDLLKSTYRGDTFPTGHERNRRKRLDHRKLGKRDRIRFWIMRNAFALGECSIGHSTLNDLLSQGDDRPVAGILSKEIPCLLVEVTRNGVVIVQKMNHSAASRREASICGFSPMPRSRQHESSAKHRRNRLDKLCDLGVASRLVINNDPLKVAEIRLLK